MTERERTAANGMPPDPAEVPLRLRGWIMVGVPLAMAGLFFAGLVTFDSVDKVTLVQATVEGQGDDRELSVSLRNNSDQDYRRVGLTLQFDDASGDPVSAVAPETAGLAPGETWQLQVPVPADEAAAFRILDLWCVPDDAPPAGGGHDNDCELRYSARF